MATLPTSGTDIRLLTGIPFSYEYKETRWFDNITQQTAYFEKQTVVHRMADSTFKRPENSTYISVDTPIEDLFGVNYVMFKNAKYGNKWFYAFVIHLEYKTRTTTYVHLALDVLQTWMFQLNFKPSFIIREHCKLWNDDGTPVINTVDEGLNYGLDYDIVHTQQMKTFGNIQFMVVVSKLPMHKDAGTDIEPHFIGAPQSLTMYVIPFYTSKLKPVIMFEQSTEKQVEVSLPTAALTAFYNNEDATNNIVSIYVTPNIGMEFTVKDDNPESNAIPAYLQRNKLDWLETVTIGDAETYVSLLKVKDVNQFEMLRRRITYDKYEGFRNVKESKLLMYPYTNLAVDDFKGNRHVYKLEYLRTKGIEALLFGSVGTGNFHSLSLNGYNSPTAGDMPLMSSVSSDAGIIDNQPNDVPVLNDYLAAYLQGNKNQIKNEQDTIKFNGIMNGIRSVADGATASAHLFNPPTNPFNAISNKIDAASGIANALIDGAQGAGNSVLQMQAIEAKQADIANVPPSIAKMGTNSAYNMGNGYNGFYFVKKQIKTEYIKKLSDFFNAYGYKVNEVKMPNLHTRRYWNYIQTTDINITANMNYGDLVQIQGIFNAGITLWHTDDIGNYSLENEVL